MKPSTEYVTSLFSVLGSNFLTLEMPPGGFPEDIQIFTGCDGAFLKIFFGAGLNFDLVEMDYMHAEWSEVPASLQSMAMQQLKNACRESLMRRTPAWQMPNLHSLLVRFHEL